MRQHSTIVSLVIPVLLVVSCSAPATPSISVPIASDTPAAQPSKVSPSPLPPSPPADAPTRVQPPPATRPTPQFNPFANMTQQQADCLRAAWGAQVFQDITTFVRPPSREEEPAMAKCGIVLGGPGQPPQGGVPQVTKDQTYFTTSADGLNWSAPTLLADKASVPDVIRTSKGVFWAYWVDFSVFTGPNQEKIGVARSEDGKTWEKLGTVKLAGLGNIVPVDPDVVELPDGRLRLYFYDIAVQQGDHPIHSAVSSDGTNYTLESGVRFKAPNIYDPDVVRLKDGRYRMYLNNDGRIISATSADGIAFTADSGVRLQVGGSIPGSIVLADGSVRLYTCEKGISVYKSSDGLTFSVEKEKVIGEPGGGIVCDPSVTATPTGYLMVYKHNPGQ